MRLLLIEDNVQLAKLVGDSISPHGLDTDSVQTAEDGLSAFRTIAYDLVILDLGLPDRDGLLLLKDIRSFNKHIPILILTSRDAPEDRVMGLNSGADDYVMKPFHTDELIARIRALLRRPGQSLGTMLTAGNLSLNTQTRSITVQGEPLRLTKREINLLEILLRSVGKAVAKESIENGLYGLGASGSANSVEVLIHRLRQKLEAGKSDVQIHTLHGLGYLLSETQQTTTHEV
jgi:DNA-binding response OmpR family regulator